MPIGPVQSIKEFSILEKKEKGMTILALLLLLLSMQVCPFSKYYCLINVLYTPPLLILFFSTKLNVFFFLFLTSIPISCCCCCHSWVNCFHVINFIDGKFVTLLVHSLLFFFLWMFAIMDMGYVGCFFFSSIRLMISTLEANTYLGMQKNQKNGVVFSLFIRDF